MTKDVERKKILDGLILGVRELFEDDRLAKFDVRERAIMGRLSQNMRKYYEGWDIDTDHERLGDDPKHLDILPDGRPGRKQIQPDIIIHELGQKKNLLVVEIKLSDNNDFALDLWKLTHMTKRYGMYEYKVGAHVVLDLEGKTADRSLVFVNGAPHPALSNWFQAQFR